MLLLSEHAIGEHRVGNFRESGAVGAVDVIHGSVSERAVLDAAIVDALHDALEALVDLGVPNYALAEYPAPENFPAGVCPLCAAGTPITRF